MIGDAEPTEKISMSTAPAPYRHIANELTEKIKNGEYPPGAKLPSTRQLAEAYGVSMVTASRALSLLHDRDLIIGRPGLGTFVAGAADSPS